MSRKDNDFLIQESNNNEFAGKMNEFEETTTDNSNYQVMYDESEKKNNNFIEFIKDYYYNHKIVFIIILLFLILLILILLISGCSRKGSMENINLDISDVIYVGETTEFTTSVTGKGSLKDTQHLFSLDNTNATLEKETLKGAKVTNKITTTSSGKITLNVKSTLKDNEKTTSKEILICKRLDENAIILESINLKLNQKFSLESNLNLGVSECLNNVKLTSSDTSILSIDENNVGTAKRTGSVTITANDGKTSQKFIVSVVSGGPKVTGLKLSSSKISLSVGESKNITATISPSNASIKDIVWTSSNEKVVTVNDGKITGVSVGNTIITAKTVDGDYKDTVSVTVNNSNGSNSMNKVNKPNSSLCKKITYNGKEQQITSIVKNDGYKLSNYKQINAGTYTITAKLNSGYVWSDNSTKNITFKCSISKADPQIKVVILGTNRVDNTLVASVTTKSTGDISYTWWHKTTSSGSKTNISNAKKSNLIITENFLNKYIGVNVTVAESNNYKRGSTSDITDKTNNTLDKVGTSEIVKYYAPTAPTITASDNIASDKWHTKNTTLSFSGSKITQGTGSVAYYYGTSESSMTKVGTSTGEISKTGTTTYYVKACNSSNTSLCSETVKYILKIDTTAPTFYRYVSNGVAYITCTDSESLITHVYSSWKKSTSSSWTAYWNYDVSASSYEMYYNKLNSSGTHNTYSKCTNGAGLSTEIYYDFCRSGSLYSGACGSTTSSYVAYTCSNIKASTATECKSYCVNQGYSYSTSTCSTTRTISGSCRCKNSSGTVYTYGCTRFSLVNSYSCSLYCQQNSLTYNSSSCSTSYTYSGSCLCKKN